MHSAKVIRTVLAFVSLTCFVAGARAQATWYVDDDASSGGDGTTWATAYDSLSTALTVAQSGDQIWVAAGAYVGNFTLALGVEVYGGFAGTETELTQRDWEANPTILDGNQSGSVITSPAGATETTRIDGFTITNGSGTPSGYSYGGGLYLYRSSPTITNNTITGNIAYDDGGALYLNSSSPTIANNTISGNSARYGGGLGLYYDTSPMIANTIVAFNSSGIYRYSGMPTLRYNCVYGNTAYDYDGLSDPTGTAGNISADPLFVQDPDPGLDGLWGTEDDDFGDLQLLSGSPCIDAGDNDSVPPDTPDLDDDGDMAEPIPIDLDGHARVLCGEVDMGAYESGIGDYECDDDVDLDDFTAWEACMTGPGRGPYLDGCEPFDFDFDSDVDLTDFAGFQTRFAKP